MGGHLFEKELQFGLLCVSFVNVYQFVRVLLFPFRFMGEMWEKLVLMSEYCLSFCIALEQLSQMVAQSGRFSQESYKPSQLVQSWNQLGEVTTHLLDQGKTYALNISVCP